MNDFGRQLEGSQQSPTLGAHAHAHAHGFWVGMGAIVLVILLVMLQILNTWAQFE